MLLLFKCLSFAEAFFSKAQCPVLFTFSLLLWGSSASSYSCTHFLFFTSSSHLVSHCLWDFFPCSDWFVFMCFHHHHHAGLWLAAVCYVPSCATDLHHLLQWVALSGLWVWALPPQALQPLAGCTGAFPGQVPSTTCVPPHLPTSENSWCSVFLLTCTIQWSASTKPEVTFDHHMAFIVSPLLEVKNICIESRTWSLTC